MQAELDRRIKEAGAENAYFPLFIPESFLKLEAEHVEGFAPELAVVTHGGGKELEEPLVVRPTSETVINSFFAKWIQSHRDLPLLINQWANVVRWELRPRLFLRTSEFLWQEGHTAHATEDDARAYALRILNDVYRSTMVDVLSMPVLTGHKTARRALRRRQPDLDLRGDDGRRQGAADGHQPRARAELRPALRHHVHQRVGHARIRLADLVGRLHPAGRRARHGPRRRLRAAPPPGAGPGPGGGAGGQGQPEVGAAATAAGRRAPAAGHRVRLDDRTDTSFGRRSVDWELKGVPVRVEVGPRDLAEGNVTVVTRHRREKQNVPVGAVAATVAGILAAAGPELLAEATAAREARTTDAASLEEAIEAGSVGFARVRLGALGPDGEDRLAQHALSSAAFSGPTARWPSPGTPRTTSWPSWPGRISPGIAIIPLAVHF